MKLTEREIRELLNMHLKSALGAATDADAGVIGERLNRCKELAAEMALQDLERTTARSTSGD